MFLEQSEKVIKLIQDNEIALQFSDHYIKGETHVYRFYSDDYESI